MNLARGLKREDAMRFNFTSSLIAVAIATVPTTVFAQAAAPAEDANPGGLETIIVTATKRSENLQNVPVAVTAISATALAKAGVFETSDLNHAMPNLQVSSPYGPQQPNFSIRGIGVGTEFNANAASPVGVYVDEVYQTFRASHGQQLYDLNQVEVVRGPQGTLYGRNTTGGAVNFITRAPSLRGMNVSATLGYGNYNRLSAEGAVEFTPIEGTLGIRVAGTYVKADPYVRNILAAGTVTALTGTGPKFSTGFQPGGLENYGFRGTIRWKPTADIDLSLKGYFGRSFGGQEVPIGTGSSTTNNTISRGTTLLSKFIPALLSHNVGGNPANGSLFAAFVATPNAAVFVPPASDLQVNVDSVGKALTRSEGVVFNAKINLNDHLKLISVTNYDSGLYQQLNNTECDASPINLCAIGYNSKFNAFTQDIRLDYSNGPLKLIFGGFYGSDKIVAANRPDFFNALSLFNNAAGNSQSYFNPAGFLSDYGYLTPGVLPTGITANNDFTQKRTSWAIYGEGNYEIVPDVKLTLGGRYTSDKTNFEGLTTFFDDTGTATAISVSNTSPTAANPLGWYFLRNILNENGTIGTPKSTGPLPGNLVRNGSSNRFSGRAIIDWKPSDKVLVYASFSRGYRAGTFNGLAYGTSAQVYFVPPESVNAYEAGIKSRFLDNKLQVNASFFYYDYKGQQGQVVDSTATANLVALDGKMKGLELEVSYAPTDTLTLNASLGLLDSSYNQATCAAGLAPPGSPQQVGNCVLAGSGKYVNVGGNPFPFAAKSSVNLGVDWDAYKNDDSKLSLHVDAAYTGNFHYDSFGDYSSPTLLVPLTPSPGVIPVGTQVPLVSGLFKNGGGNFWSANARATFTHKNYAISFWMKNVFDKTSYPYGIATEFLFGNDYRVRNQPRTFGGEVTVKF
jgi:iron complex outermembrane recepter protein